MQVTPRPMLRQSTPWIALVLSGLLVIPNLFAQQTPTFSVSVRVVNVLTTVRDKHGNIVNSLTQDDFKLEEDGRAQTIRYFARETDMPLTLGLLVDTSLSQVQVLDEEKTASAAFANDVLREGKDSAFLIHFDHEVELLQELTSSREKLASALEGIDESHYDRWGGGGYPGGRGGSGRHGGGPGGGTLLYDAIFLASDEEMQKLQGRKAVIILTDGVDHGSRMSLDRAIESAQRADTMVYSIYFLGQEGGWGFGRHGTWGGGHHGRGYPGGYPQPSSGGSEEGKKVLERLSRETGGRMFVVSKKEPIDKIYAQIQDELRNQYSLGYTPDREAENGRDYRHIHVTTKQKDLKVQAREGYYASRQIAATQGQ
jgi:VWFA-related protein